MRYSFSKEHKHVSGVCSLENNNFIQLITSEVLILRINYDVNNNEKESNGPFLVVEFI